MDKYTVEDAAMGFITMKNGAVIVLESSWALNILDDRQAKCTLCGVDGGADMNDGLRLNYVVDDKMVVTKPDLEASGVDYFGGAEDTPGVLEARQWLDAVINDTEPLVLPERSSSPAFWRPSTRRARRAGPSTSTRIDDPKERKEYAWHLRSAFSSTPPLGLKAAAPVPHAPNWTA